MKKMMKTQSYKSRKVLFLEKVLKKMAVFVLKKYKPRIIGITGSVGKTSAKEAVFKVLSGHYRVRKNEKNYNNEIGLPLTIIGAESGERSPIRWAGVFLKWLVVFIFPVKYPEVLILEMGTDRPGDIKYLTGFIPCEMAIITDISGSHLEYFKTIEKIAEEKWTLAENVLPGGTVALNIDNAMIAKLKNQKKNEKMQFLSFGFSEGSDLSAQEVLFNYADRKEIKGLSFKLNYKGTNLPVRLNNILAEHNIYSALAGVAAGIVFKINLVEIASALSDFSLPQGRMTLISGIKNTSIIDDTYNSSPVSALAALDILKKIKAPRKIAVMGDMLELGDNFEAEHRQVAKKFLETGADIFFAVGRRMRFAANELGKHNIGKERLFVFSGPDEAGRSLQEILRPGDLVLVKGSQGMRMEKIVEEIIAEPEKAEFYLCRQSASWKNKPWREV